MSSWLMSGNGLVQMSRFSKSRTLLVLCVIFNINNGQLISLPSSCNSLQTFGYNNGGSSRQYAMFLPEVFCDNNLLIQFINSNSNININSTNYLQVTLPIFLIFHGLTESPSTYLNRWDWNEWINNYGLIAILPYGGGDGRQLSWNAGPCCGDNRNANVDDINFINNLLMDIIFSLTNTYEWIDIDIADENKINLFITGHSNGGFMADTMSWLYNIPITAAIPVSGYIYNNQILFNQRTLNTINKSVNIMYIHGDSDIVVSLNGCTCNAITCCCDISIFDENDSCLPLHDAFLRWADFNGCNIDNTFVNTDCVTAIPIVNQCMSYTSICILEGVGHSIYDYNQFNNLRNEMIYFFIKSLCLKQNGSWNQLSKSCDCPLSNELLLYCSNQTSNSLAPTNQETPTAQPTQMPTFNHIQSPTNDTTSDPAIDSSSTNYPNADRSTGCTAQTSDSPIMSDNVSVDNNYGSVKMLIIVVINFFWI